MIIGRRDFYHIHAYQVDTGQTTNNIQRLKTAQPPWYGSAGARRKCRVETVDVKGQVNRVIANTLLDLTDQVAGTVFIDIGR